MAQFKSSFIAISKANVGPSRASAIRTHRSSATMSTAIWFGFGVAAQEKRARTWYNSAHAFVTCRATRFRGCDDCWESWCRASLVDRSHGLTVGLQSSNCGSALPTSSKEVVPAVCAEAKANEKGNVDENVASSGDQTETHARTRMFKALAV